MKIIIIDENALKWYEYQICACNYFHKNFLEKRIFPLIYPNLLTCFLPPPQPPHPPPPPKKKKYLLTCWIFFTFRWKHCYFMWVLLDSNIKAMQRMFENEKQVLFLFSSLFHLIQFKREYMLEFQALYMGNMIPHEIFWKENSFIFWKLHFISTKSNDAKNLMYHVIKFCPFLFYFLYFNS